jgi:hypothetical protein
MLLYMYVFWANSDAGYITSFGARLGFPSPIPHRRPAEVTVTETSLIVLDCTTLGRETGDGRLERVGLYDDLPAS